ncbi:class I SAM-dependent methyltransferase [Paenibacillus sp. J2TS4]|uniref:class I SAM-dependent methyltransferase n=1 Tax=Paenibacillus sp. J2TS4 TaxID=2807194 RepID=UPI001BCFEB9A|nr:class I SAM-dependent methyltransferase [Paenibacillus sp. J2TS4]
MIVTTSYNPTEGAVARSRRFAEENGWTWVPRERHSLRQLALKYGDERIWSVSDKDLNYYDHSDTPLFFHPSMALVRIKRLLQGETDSLLLASGVRQGDTVLDCTAGLASDSIVFSYAVGSEGGVTALESEQALAVLLQEGLQTYRSGIPQLDEAMRRIHVMHQDHAAYLKELPDNSFDLVYFDPMFRMPVQESSHLSPLREVANTAPLQNSTILEATRVARKAVVLKELRGSREFERLGFNEKRSSSKISYGVISW